MKYENMTQVELNAEYKAQVEHFEACKAKNLKLNMARGKPAAAQLDIVNDILTTLVDPAECFVDGFDARNYGELAGLPSARA